MPFNYRLQQLQFRDGTPLDLTNLTVFVGANNSGKSRILKDIVSLTCEDAARNVIVGAVIPTLPRTVRELVEAYNIVPNRESNGAVSLRYLKPDFAGQGEYGFGRVEWPDGLTLVGFSPKQLATMFGASLIAFLTTAQRLRLVEAGTLNQGSRSTLLQELYQQKPMMERLIRRRVLEAFPNTELALDFSDPPKVEFRVARGFAGLPADPRLARLEFAKHERLDDQGDGIRSYAGIVTAMLCSRRPVFLIDEPEAFLHPPQAYRIGQFIASLADERRQIIVATHSVDVLRGLVSRDRNPKIVHLDRVGNMTRHAVLEATDIRTIYNDPLLSGPAILNGLFFAGAVVTEADADTRFYAAVSAKLDRTRDLHFVNADNKQTVPKVLRAYKKMGVRAAGIVDIDVLNDAVEFVQHLDDLGVIDPDRTNAIVARDRIEAHVNAAPLGQLLQEISTELSRQKAALDAAVGQSPAAQEDAMKLLRAELGNLREKAGVWARLKKEGRAALGALAADFDLIAVIMARHGVVVNPTGELEACLV